MKTYLRIICAVIALLTACGCFTACNSGKSGEADTTAADSATVAAEETTVTVDNSPAAIFNLGYDGAADIRVNLGADGRVILPDDPSRDGFGFKGWYTEKDGKGDRVTVATAPGITDGQTVTYYAYWTEYIDMTNRNKIRIGGFNGITEDRATEEDFKLLAEAGIDEIYMTFFHDDSEDGRYTLAKSLQYMKWMEQYGIKCWYNDFKLNDLLKQHADKEQIMALLGVYKDSPSFIGNYLADEPAGDYFEELSAACTYYSELMPGYQMYVNLLPNIAAAAAFYPDKETGKKTFDAYANAFCEMFPCTYVSQDFYPINTQTGSNKTLASSYYSSLYSTANAAKAGGKEHWMYIYAMYAPIPELNCCYMPGLNEIRFEAFNAMAFGCCGITMYCFDCPPSYYGLEACCGFIRDHQKSDIFEPGKQVITEIKALSEVFPKYIWQDTCGYANGSSQIMKLLSRKVPTCDQYLESVSAGESNLLIGVFDEANGDGKAYMIVNEMDLNKPESETVTVKFTGAQKVTAYIGTASTVLEPANGNEYTFTVEPGQGCFLTVDY